MTDWICPACGGGFPDDAMLAHGRGDGIACPWCHQMIQGYDPDMHQIERARGVDND